MTVASDPPPLPAPDVPLVDKATGKVNRDWYVYLLALDKKLRSLVS